MLRKWIVLLVVVLGLLALDQWTKLAVIDHLALYETIQPIPALAPFFQITHTENLGAAFGFLPEARGFFVIVAVVVAVAMAYFYPRVETWVSRVAIGMICAGALGNGLDRIQRGVVTDFIHYQIPGLISNVSNIADHALVLGVITILLESWIRDRQKAASETDAPDENTVS
ncbi:MAG: signal peptidase II [Anaerolineae bacterium]|nr:signal peptidase II [Anaerolineae bacterium]